MGRKCKADIRNHRESTTRSAANAGPCVSSYCLQAILMHALLDAELTRKDQIRALWQRAFDYVCDKTQFGWSNRRMLMQVGFVLPYLVGCVYQSSLILGAGGAAGPHARDGTLPPPLRLALRYQGRERGCHAPCSR